ncbi:MAG: hypothetical protein WBO46_09440 [Caldilineaceae bacterium]
MSKLGEGLSGAICHSAIDPTTPKPGSIAIDSLPSPGPTSRPHKKIHWPGEGALKALG